MKSVLYFKIFGKEALGKVGLVLVIIPLLVSISTVGSAISSMYGSPRLALVAAREGSLVEVLSCIHNKFKTPVLAIILQVCTLSLRQETSLSLSLSLSF